MNPTPTNDTGAVDLGLDVDAAGNQYVAGALQNGAGSGAPAVRSFGSTSLSSGFGFSYGFVGKLSPAQQWQWAVRASTNANANAEGADFRQVTTSPVASFCSSATATTGLRWAARPSPGRSQLEADASRAQLVVE